MAGRRVPAERIHGAGEDAQVEIVLAADRLHGSGVFSNVYQVQLLEPVVKTVAVKSVWLTKASIDQAAFECATLRRLQHPHVIRLLYRYRVTNGVEAWDGLVFDFLPSDVARLRLTLPGRRFDVLDAKLYGWQLTAALDYVNAFNIAHMDVKPSNLLVDPRAGILRLADFGNARPLARGHRLNSYQVTRYYRAPELVFGADDFTTAVDRWSLGCVLAELSLGRPLLCGRDAVDQGRLIVEVLGYPNGEQLKAMRIARPRLVRRRPRGWEHLLPAAEFPSTLRDLVARLLVYEPRRRLPTAAALAHPHFDALRAWPPPRRTNGALIPPLAFTTLEQATQSTSSRPASALL